MADKPSSKQKGSSLGKLLAQRRSYLIGVALGLLLITINSIIGLYVVDLVLSETDIDPDMVQTLPVPEINEAAYTNFRNDFLDRQEKNSKSSFGNNPFKTD